MKKILIWIFMLSSQLVVAEKQECVLHGKIHKSISFEKLYLTIEGKVIDSATIDGNSFDFKILFEPGSICKIETLEKLGNHAKMVRTQAVCYLAAGTISVEIYELSDENPEFSYKLLGPLLTQDYEEKLRVPVLKYNGIIRDLKSKLNTANSADSAFLKAQISENMIKCFGIPKKYIHENSSSILCITALKMLGVGDPSASDPKKELEDLFNSLSIEVRDSEPGKKYAEGLKKMMN